MLLEFLLFWVEAGSEEVETACFQIPALTPLQPQCCWYQFHREVFLSPGLRHPLGLSLLLPKHWVTQIILMAPNQLVNHSISLSFQLAFPQSSRACFALCWLFAFSLLWGECRRQQGGGLRRLRDPGERVGGEDSLPFWLQRKFLEFSGKEQEWLPS